MIAIYTLCAFIAWTPAWDITLEQDVELHYFYEDDRPGITAWNNEMEVCRVDYDVPHTYSVAGYVSDPENEGQLLIGPESDDLTVVWPTEVPEPDTALLLLAGMFALLYLERRHRRNR